jgi:SAM-dependent methyltransferase
MPADYRTLDDAALAQLDALLAAGDKPKWQRFYQDRSRPCPFFELSPDENLSEWVNEGRLRPGHALDIGCGNGRNAIFLAQHGFTVQAIDYSDTAIAWAAEEVAKAEVAVALTCCSAFELQLAPGSLDFIYDSGCFHHLAPHRRHQYVDLVARTLRPGGCFGLVCFAPEGGSGHTDEDVYRLKSMGGGLGYDEGRLRKIWSPPLDIVSLRRMREPAPGTAVFGQPYLWTLLARRR